MKSLLKLVRRLNVSELRHVSAAIDLEMSRRAHARNSTADAGVVDQTGAPAIHPLPMVASGHLRQNRAA